MSEGEPIITDFEMEEEVFVPKNDREPARWKRKGDLQLDEFARYVQSLRDASDQRMARTVRYAGIVKEARRRGGRDKTLLSDVLTDQEVTELLTLKMTLDAQEREEASRDAAINRDLAAGRFRAWLPKTD
jgi:hypothetical protein